MIVVYGPCPHVHGVRNGWLRRIAAVDALLADRERVYVWPERTAYRADPHDYRPLLQEVAPGVRQLLLDLRWSLHHRALRLLIDEAEFVYAHTSHSAQHLLPYYATGKVVTDLHGIAPEEEQLQGYPNRAGYFAALEAVMVAQSARLVVVTEAMLAHLRAKYPGLATPHLVLPIVEQLAEVPRTPAGERPRVIYSGGLQAWQNVDAMLDAVARVGDRCAFRFLTEQRDELRARLSARGLDGVEVATLAPEQLPAAYAAAEFGFVLRKDTAVNRVSCPTKLSEYLATGVVPIVELAALGDFERLGYRFVTLADFLAGRLPPAAELADWRRHNRSVYEAIGATFRRSAAQLAQLRLEPPAAPAAPGALALTTLERDTVYPLHGLSLQLRFSEGERQLPLHDVADAEVETSLELGGADAGGGAGAVAGAAAGALVGLRLQADELPMVVAPATVEVEDRSGDRHRLELLPPARDRFGNWLFADRGSAAVAAGCLIAEPVRLHLRFEILAIGAEVALLGPSPSAAQLPSSAPSPLQLLWRRLGRRRASS